MSAHISPPMARCPQCGVPRPYSAANPWRPFCSERCRAVDLGAWASDGYVIAGAASEERERKE